MSNSTSVRRIAFAGDLMSEGQWASLQLADFGGTFIGESGNRGDKGVMASMAYIPEIAEEEARLTKNDRLHRFVSDEDLEAPEPMDVDVIEEPAVGSKFIAPKGTVDEALAELFRKSPKYVIEAYTMANRTGRLDVLNHVPGVVAGLVKEGVYSLELFQRTPAGNGFSAYRTLKGYASTEQSSVLGGNSGIARRILKILQDGQM